jgi:hypothetical protein
MNLIFPTSELLFLKRITKKILSSFARAEWRPWRCILFCREVKLASLCAKKKKKKKELQKCYWHQSFPGLMTHHYEPPHEFMFDIKSKNSPIQASKLLAFQS